MQNHVFQYDRGIWRVMSVLADFLVLDLLFLLCAIPVVTTGVGLSALYYVVFKLIERENNSTVRAFCKSFRENLRQGLGITLIFLAFALLLGFDFVLLRPVLREGGVQSVLVTAVLIFLLILYLVAALYVFPLQARFYNPVAATFRNALLIGFSHLPLTACMLLCDGAFLALTGLTVIYAPRFAYLPFSLLVPLTASVNAWLMRGILGLEPGKGDKAVPDDDIADEEEETPEDGE